MSRVDEKIPARKLRTDHVVYHKHEQGNARVTREKQRNMKRFGWLSVEDKK